MQSKNTRDFSHDMNYTNGMLIVFDVVLSMSMMCMDTSKKIFV